MRMVYIIFILIFTSLPAFSECIRLTMEDAEIMAISNNPNLQESKFRSAADYWLYQSELSRLFPNLTFFKRKGSTNSQPKTSVFLGRSVRYTEETLRFDQLVFSLPIYFETKSFDFRFAASFYNYLEELVQTIARVRIAHARVITNRQIVEVYQRLLNLFWESYENEEIKLTVGESTRFENVRNRLAYTNTLAEYYRAVANVQLAKSEWLRTIGVDPDADDIVTYDVVESEIPITDNIFIEELLLRVHNHSTQIRQPLFTFDEIFRWMKAASFNRPLVRRFQAEYQTADMLVKSAWGAYAPEVRFYYSQEKRDPPELYGTRKAYHDYGVSLSWNIFDSFGREARINQSQMEREIAKWATEEAWTAVQLEVRDRSAELEQALYSLISSKQSEDLANEGIREANELLALGDLTLFEYRDMVQSLGRAGLDLAQSNFSLAASYYSLLAAVGLQNIDAGTLLLHGCEGDDSNDQDCEDKDCENKGCCGCDDEQKYDSLNIHLECDGCIEQKCDESNIQESEIQESEIQESQIQESQIHECNAEVYTPQNNTQESGDKACDTVSDQGRNTHE